MAEKGFVYIPVVDFTEGPEQLEGGLGEPPPLEQVERIGFGIVSSIEWEMSEAAAELRAMPDPNDEIRAALSPDQLEQYDRALSGASMSDLEELGYDSGSGDASLGLSEEESESSQRVSEGCLFQAYGEGLPSEPVTDLLFSDSFADLQAAIESDPETIRIQADWAACMAAEGHQYESHQAASSDIYSRADIILARARRDGLDPGSAQLAGELEALKLLEIEIALADLACGEGIAERFLELSRRHEIDFIHANEGQILAVLEE